MIGAALLGPAVGRGQGLQPPATLPALEGPQPIGLPLLPAGDLPEAAPAGNASSTLRLIQDGWGQKRVAEPATSTTGSVALRWRSPQPAEPGQRTGISVPLEPADWQNRQEDPRVRPVSHEQSAERPAKAFADPFGDRLAQAGLAEPQPTRERPPSAPADLPTLDDLLPPLGEEDAARLGETRPRAADLPQLSGNGEQDAAPFGETRPRATIQPPAEATPGEARPPLRTPAPFMPPADPVQDPDRTDGRRIYNQRDCHQEEESCQAARLALKQTSIRNISLDITASFRPEAETLEEEHQARQDQLRLMPARVWHNRRGEVLAEGRVIDLQHRRIVVRQDDGTTRTIPLGVLGDDELCFLAAYWRVPTECTLGDETYIARNWYPHTFTWTASALCHKPLYFEERQLERYGHTFGPVVEPVLSGAHFFLNVAVLPYKMGINPPNECQYALGYYRPGSCAPRLLPPVPLSVRGGLMQAGAVTGLVFLFP